jgi:hypothetical protein
MDREDGKVPVTNLKGFVTLPPSSSGSGISMSGILMVSVVDLWALAVFVEYGSKGRSIGCIREAALGCFDVGNYTCQERSFHDSIGELLTTYPFELCVFQQRASQPLPLFSP